MHDGFDVIGDQPWDREQCWQVDFQQELLIAGQLASWEQQITLAARYTDFEQWKHDLDAALTNHLGQPQTPQTMFEVKRIVDRHFRNSTFQHLHHEITVQSDGSGLSVGVTLTYDDPMYFYEDFEIDAEDSFELAALDGYWIDAVFGLNAVGDNDLELMEDAYWAVAKQAAAEIGSEVAQAVEEARPLVKTDIPKEKELLRRNADDILFSPIEREEDKKPETPNPTADWDAGCYCWDCG